MAEFQLPTPWGIEDDATGGTEPEEMQQLIAARYEFKGRSSPGRGGIIRHSGPAGDGNGVELRPDATLRVHMGAVLLDIEANRCAEAVIPYVDAIAPGLTVGTAGTVTVYVGPPAAGSNNARLVTTSGTAPAGVVVLDKIKLPAGWTRTNQGTRVHDREYAVLQGTSNGQLSAASDSDSAHRTTGPYRRLAQSFVVPTDCNISLALTTTIRSITSAGAATQPLRDSQGSVLYRVYIDGALHTSYEIEINGYATSTFHESMATVSAGRHEVWVESSISPAQSSLRWQVLGGGSLQHRGDFLRVRHEGVRW